MKTPICIAVDSQAKNSDMIKFGYFKCSASDQNIVASGDMLVAYSPFADNVIMKSVSQKLGTMSVGDIKKDKALASIGPCPACSTEHFVSASDAKELVKHNQNIHCTLCSSEYAPVVASKLLQTISNDMDNDSEEDDEDDNDLATLSADDDDDDSEDDNDDDSDDDSEEDNTETEAKPVVQPTATEPVHEVQNDHPANGGNNDLQENGEIVSANTKEFAIDCLVSNGGFQNKSPLLMHISSTLAYILDNELPVLKLTASKAGDNAGLFNDPTALGKAFNAILASGQYDFSGIGAEPIVYTVNVDQQVQNKIDNTVQATVTEYTEKKNIVAEEYKAAVAIASSIINKNIEKANPIREKLVEVLSTRNISATAAAQLADSVLETTANDYSAAVFTKTDELMNMPLAVRNEMGKFVMKSAYKTNTVEASADNKENLREKLVEQLASGNVAFSTALTTTASEIKPDNNSNIERLRSLIRSH